MKVKLDKKLWGCWVKSTASIIRFDVIGLERKYFEIDSQNNSFLILKNLSENDLLFISNISKNGLSVQVGKRFVKYNEFRY